MSSNSLIIILLTLTVIAAVYKENLPMIHALSAISPTNNLTTIRVCTGSSCLSKCKAGFDPLSSFQSLHRDENQNINIGDNVIKIEETFCMNQCKRGPNARIIRQGQVITFEEGTGIMNDVELKRKSFQGIGSENRVNFLWNLVKDLHTGNVNGVESGDAEKLSDLMPHA
jgi:(2Fe-2S) ferredoxin